jgi:hypothetical protein
MDKPRHPLVIRPWKTQQTQRNKGRAPTVKAGTASERLDMREPRMPFPTKTHGKGANLNLDQAGFLERVEAPPSSTARLKWLACGERCGETVFGSILVKMKNLRGALQQIRG